MKIKIKSLFDGISNQELIIATFVFTSVLIGVYVSRTNLDCFLTGLAIEDGPAEWATVFGLLMCSVLCFFRAFRLYKDRSKLFLAVLLFCGAVFLFGAGEEISWGQRLFDVKSGDFFAKHNVQGETNIHNLVVGSVKINKLVFGKILGILIVIYFLIMPPLYQRVDKVKRIIDGFAVPIPRYYHIFFYIVLALLSEAIPTPKKGELLEFSGAFMFFITLFNPLNQAIFRDRTPEK